MFIFGFTHAIFLSNLSYLYWDKKERAFRQSDFWWMLSGLALSLLTHLLWYHSVWGYHN